MRQNINGQAPKGGRSRAGRWFALWPGILFLIGFFGCAPLISREVLKSVDRDMIFSRVIENPTAYIGATVLWGGIIRENLVETEGTKVIVTQSPLDRRGYPQIQATEGEFIAQTPLNLDPQRYRAGRKITIAGEIDRVEERQLGSLGYPRPVLRAREIYLWEEELWGVFPLTWGWKLDQYGPVPSPFEDPHEQGSGVRRSYP